MLHGCPERVNAGTLDRMNTHPQASVSYNPAVALAGRVLMGLLFLISGITKATGYAATVGYFAKIGLPAPDVMAMLAIAIEGGGGLLLILGWRARWVAW